MLAGPAFAQVPPLTDDVIFASGFAGLEPEVRHLANSAATLTAPEHHFDLVRPGLAVYGLSPVPDVGGPEDFGLRPAMTLTGSLGLLRPFGRSS